MSRADLARLCWANAELGVAVVDLLTERDALRAELARLTQERAALLDMLAARERRITDLEVEVAAQVFA